MSYAKIVADGKASKVWTADELKAIKLKTPDQYKLVGVAVPQLDIPPKTNGTAKFGIDTMRAGHAVRQAGGAAGALRRQGDRRSTRPTPRRSRASSRRCTLDDKTATTTGWVVAVATTYEGAKKAADALKSPTTRVRTPTRATRR